jgi:hypothetical protein
MGQNIIEQLTEKYPFMSLCMYAGVEYVGIIQNRDESITTIYDFGNIQDTTLKMLFLELANVWWWESNRSVPINIFLKHEWTAFKPCRRTFVNKDLVIMCGPICSLSDIAKRKSKRKSITLVRRMDRS